MSISEKDKRDKRVVSLSDKRVLVKENKSPYKNPYKEGVRGLVLNRK